MSNKEQQSEDTFYRELARHLDKQAVGFPSTRKGAEIRLLKHIFTPFEAQLALGLSFRAESLDLVFERVGHLCQDKELLRNHLDAISKKGGRSYIL